MQGVSGSNPLGSIKRINQSLTGFSAACKGRFLMPKRLNVTLDAQNDAQNGSVAFLRNRYRGAKLDKGNNAQCLLAEPGSDAWLSAGSLLAGGVWVNSDPVASLAPGLRGLKSF